MKPHYQECSECKICQPRCEFSPRNNKVFKEDLPPRINQITRQHKCLACNRIYNRRRRFFHGALQRAAKSINLPLMHVQGSCYRKITLEHCLINPDEIKVITDLLDEFNTKKLNNYQDTIRHGIKLELNATALIVKTDKQGQLFF